MFQKRKSRRWKRTQYERKTNFPRPGGKTSFNVDSKKVYNYLQRSGMCSREELMKFFNISKGNLSLICHRINQKLVSEQIVRVSRNHGQISEYYIESTSPVLVGTAKP